MELDGSTRSTIPRDNNEQEVDRRGTASSPEQHLGAFMVLAGPAAAFSRAFVALQVPAGAFVVCRRSTWGPLWWDGRLHGDRDGAEAAARGYAERLAAAGC